MYEAIAGVTRHAILQKTFISRKVYFKIVKGILL